MPTVDLAALQAALADEGELRPEEPMARHTTLRLGGPAEAWVAPATIAALARVRRLCAMQHWPCRAVGGGTNLLVRDGGLRGVVLATGRLRGLRFDGPVVTVEAGVATGKLLAEATRRGLGGIEFLGGVPGSVGGGLVMNAGTYLGELKDVTRQVRLVDQGGDEVLLAAAACGFVYRGSSLPPSAIVVAGELLLEPRPREAIEAAVRGLRERRRAREPHGVANAGSFFKNPSGDYAGRLIEAAGLKGRRRGAAEVSPVHGNWIVNHGGARAADVLALIDEVREEVARRTGITLELEVKLLGDDPTEA